MKSKPKPLTLNCLALAYELRQSGVSWKLISRYLNISPGHAKDSIKRCKEEGTAWVRR